mmetsp:Transcript_21567/g.45492  ORF Transcript_21567/g.45492 Transcript_21567/m.45492 type:complete len:333 (+) Transcript_21567:69-1067(+)|eukprot:CAMPEP_0201163798 /NCGR_PEP_ID=MMETSP0851-20130426/58060_1 /ASSEMBLY_ACC=CAM_ASM_000631 /TAXON_ID=183588 /ORGANISM="Pseudo-nitzschia fraudulenta, Strain WWA7" /LENGTH=332 /DNA_ID=CAMNT_0047444057 /DNA_START=70 /DNA_END=1068 /DNA_ORIENTATION=+
MAAIHFVVKSLFCLFVLIAEAGGMAVHNVLFPTDRDGAFFGTNALPLSATPTTISPSPSLVVFVHGRLEADPVSDGMDIPRPAELYSDFCNGLADETKKDVLLVDYHEHYKDWGREPRDLGLGPVTSAIGEAIRNHIATTTFRTDTATPKITLVSFSMGAAIVLKLLGSDPTFQPATLSSSLLGSSEGVLQVEKLILVEPVWRCWLPFAVARATEAGYSPSNNNNNGGVGISKIPSLALVGTRDEEVQHDCGGAGMGGSGPRNSSEAVVRTLRPFLSNVSAIDVTGGNHFGGLCSGPPDIREFIEEGLAPDTTPESVRKELIGRISEFCASK